MGADLYINKLYRPNYEAHQDAFRAACGSRDAASQEAEALYVASGETLTVEVEADRAKAAKFQVAVDAEHDAMYSTGYFRDSYNNSAVLWQMGLSWWKDVIPMLNKANNLSGDNLKMFLQMLLDHPVEAGANLKEYRQILKGRGFEFRKGSDTPREWRDYFVQKRLDLISIVGQASQLRTVTNCAL